MKLRLIIIALILSSASACAPRVLCPAYAIEDAQPQQEKKENKEQRL